MNEIHEALQTKYMEVAYKSMAEILENPEAPNEDKFKAARIISSMNNAIFASHAISENARVEETTRNKLTSQLDKLNNRGE